jgi:hypothetical protein
LIERRIGNAEVAGLIPVSGLISNNLKRINLLKLKMKIDKLKRLGEFIMRHKVIAFILVMCITILYVRVSVMIHNPNPTIFNFELHHFDYGMILLLIASLLLIFKEKKHSLYLILTAISFGLVLDDIWFIRSNILDPTLEEVAIYNASLPIVIFLVLITVVAVLLINYFRK